MTKNRSKVPARRRDVRPKPRRLDPNLAAVLAEYQFDQNYKNWFALPWRDGWNAVWLAWACWRRLSDGVPTPSSSQLVGWYEERHVRPGLHEEAETLAVAEAHRVVFSGNDSARFLLIGLRCVQLIVANSHGGGRVFNDVLSVAFERCPHGWHKDLAGFVRYARGCDSLGVDFAYDNSPDDRLREAFQIAWDQGLFHAAYALPQGKGLK